MTRPVCQDGVDNTGMSKDKLYSTPEDVFKAGEKGVAFEPTSNVTWKVFLHIQWVLWDPKYIHGMDPDDSFSL